MTDELKSNLTELARIRQSLVSFEKQRNFVQAELEKDELFQQLEYFKSCIKTAKESETLKKYEVAQGILKVYDGENKSIEVDGHKCGMVKSKTFITIKYPAMLVKWLIDKKLDNLLLPNEKEVKKIAKALKPDGVNIQENILSPEVKVDLSAFLLTESNSDKKG